MSFETPPGWSGSPSGRVDDGLEGTWRYWQSHRPEWPLRHRDDSSCRRGAARRAGDFGTALEVGLVTQPAPRRADPAPRPWSPGLERCRLLCSSAPSLDLVSKRSHAVSGGPAFSLFATAATRGAIPVPNRYLDELLAWAPLSVIDDLIDHGGLLPEDAPWTRRNAEEGLYLRPSQSH